MKNEPSPAAGQALRTWGWVHNGAGKYTHPDLPGHEIWVKGHEAAGGGRLRTVWQHTEPDGHIIDGTGVEQLGYHIVTTSKRNGLV